MEATTTKKSTRYSSVDHGRKRRINFSKKVSVRAIKPISKMSDEEISDRWYNRTEFSVMRSEEKEETLYLERIGRFGSSLGLETKWERRQRHHRQKSAKYSCLMEQERQWESNEFNEDLLSKIYSSSCLESIQDAQERGRIIQSQASGNEAMDDSTAVESSSLLASKDSLPELSMATVKPCSQRWRVTSSSSKNLSLSTMNMPYRIRPGQ